MTFFITDKPTPVLNTPYFERVYGKALSFDDQYLVRALEYIAFPKQVFEVVKQVKPGIFQVSTSAYVSTAPLFVDQRFGKVEARKPPFSHFKVPSKEVISKKLLSKQGLPYVWGGNWSTGIPEWDSFYPPPAHLCAFERAHWSFLGLDCSGLLYEVMEGSTPRNTKELMTYGDEISFAERKPLDLILYPGHVLIMLSKDEVIESSHRLGGVVVSCLEKRIAMIKTPPIFRRFL